MFLSVKSVGDEYLLYYSVYAYCLKVMTPNL